MTNIKSLIPKFIQYYIIQIFKVGLVRAFLIRLILVSIFPSILITWVTLESSIQIIRTQSFEALLAVNRVKNHSLEHYFEGILTSLRLEAEHNNTVDFLVALKSAYQQSGQSLKTFTRSYLWAEVEDKHAADLSYFLTTYSYIDVLLMDDEGNILYSIRQNSDLGTNLFNGENEMSKFSIAARRTYKTGISIYSDMERYGPYKNEITSFVTQVVVNEAGDKLGVLAIQLSQTKLEEIMFDHLEDYGNIYLVGEDLLMRSNILSNSEPSILQVKVESAATVHWRKSQTEQENSMHLYDPRKIYKDYQGQRVLGISLPIEFAGVNMLLLAELNEEKTFLPIEDLISLIVIIFIVTIFVASVFSIYIAETITAPIIKLTQWARQLSNGILIRHDIQMPDNEIRVLNEAFVSVVDSLQAVSMTVDKLSMGDVSQNIVPRSEDDVLVININRLNDVMNTVMNQAKEIAQGNYDVVIHLRSSKDMLGLSLQAMQKSMSLYNEKISKNILKIKLQKHDIEISRKELEVKTKELLLFIDNANAPIFGIDKAGLINEWNQKAIKITGFSKKDVIGKHFVANFITEDYRDSVQYVLDEALKGIETDNYEFPLYTKQNKRLDILLNSTPRRDINGSIIGVIGVGQDISKLKKNQQDLIQSAKLATLGELAAGMAHELNQPFNVIRLLAATLTKLLNKKHGAKKVKMLNMLEKIDKQTVRGADIIDRIKYFGRKTEEVYEAIDITTVIKGALLMFPYQSGWNNILVSESIGDDVIFVNGNKTQLEQVVLNLLMNAFDQLMYLEVDQVKKVHIGIIKCDETVEFFVQDNGEGVDDKNVKNIFTSFFSTKHVHSGTGLGLSICRQIVESMGGSITLENINDGARFTVVLPLLDKQASEAS